jgi:hypothetical protein
LEDHPEKPGKVGWFDEPKDPKLTPKNLDVDQKTWGNPTNSSISSTNL